MTTDVTLARADSPAAGVPRFDDERLTAIAQRVGYSFADADIISRALTHPSASRQVPSENQRIEFLGDSVVSLFTAHYLYRNRPNWDEGRCTSIKSVVVSTDSLSSCANEIGLREFCRLGGDLSRRTDLPPSVGANLFEALVGAIYLDGGLEPAVDFLERMLIKRIDSACRPGADTNYKGQLQQASQRLFHASPNYRLIRVKGSPHSRVFVVSAVIAEQTYPSGEGTSKKAAEQEAARLALEAIGQLERMPEPDAQPPLAAAAPPAVAETLVAPSAPSTPLTRLKDSYVNPLRNLDHFANRIHRAFKLPLRVAAGLGPRRPVQPSAHMPRSPYARRLSRTRIAVRRAGSRSAARKLGIL